MLGKKEKQRSASYKFKMKLGFTYEIEEEMRMNYEEERVFIPTKVAKLRENEGRKEGECCRMVGE